MAVSRVKSSGGGGGGWITIADVRPTASGAVGSKVYQTPQNDVLLSCEGDTLSVDVDVTAAGPRVLVGPTFVNLARISGESHYAGTIALTLGGSSTITAHQIMPDGTLGAQSPCDFTYQVGPAVLTCVFTGGYPGSQTELKAGDTFQITGTTDAAISHVEIQDFGAFDLALIVGSGTAFTVTGTVADRGTSVQALAARVRARNATGSFGATFDTDSIGTTDGVNRVNLNNIYPTVTIGTITYPPTQAALKGGEGATVGMTTSDLDTISYASPTGDLNITSPTLDEAVKTVARIAGSYNDSVTNFQATANRAANDATTISGTVVVIANVAAAIGVTEPAARLRSGGNDGTIVQGHIITITSDQQLAATPTLLAAPGGGTFIGSWVGGPTVYTRTLQVHDNDTKGAYTWTGLSATNLAGLPTTTITGDNNYVLGGFVPRDVTFSAFSQTVNITVEVVTYTKLTAGVFTATNQPSTRNPAQGNHSDLVDTYTVDALSTNPTPVWWNDVAAASANSSGTAQLLTLEETV